MSLNSNVSLSQYQDDFIQLGKNMHRYAIASWISLGLGFFGGFIIQMAIMTPMMNSYNSGSINNLYDLLVGIGGILIFYVILSFIITVYQYVTYIQYLMQLKKVGEYTSDFDLQKAYKMELGALIISIILIILIPILLISIFGGSILMNIQTEEDIYSLLMMLFGFMFVMFIVAILAIVFQVLSVLAFDRWGQRIKSANYQNPYARSIAEGTNFMKFGRIIAIFVGSIGSVLFLIGFMKAGKNIIEFFNNSGNIPPVQSATFQQ
ncbi:MAG: hypothetical protein ACTSVK_08035, partial [Promethearchaeota archaeon]